MHRLFAVLSLSLVASCGASAGGMNDGGTADRDQAATQISGVIASYDSAVVAGDTARAAGFLHPELVVYEHGHVEGSRDEFVKDHLPGDIDFMRNATMTRGDQAVHVASSGDLAYTTTTYELRGEYEGKKVHSAGTETLVLARTDAGWKIRHAHYSGHKVEAGT
jgi:ketosteroid isomerase-like protein